MSAVLLLTLFDIQKDFKPRASPEYSPTPAAEE